MAETADKYVNRKQAAEFLRQRGCSVSYDHLRNLASRNSLKNGPPFFKDGTSRVLYKLVDLENWWRERLRPAGR